jgi:hypothetical protein
MLHRGWSQRISDRADALSSGRYDLLVEEYTYPLTVFLLGAPRVLCSRDEAWAFFQSLHGTLNACGIHRVTAELVAEDLPRGGRVRLWTDWYGEGPKLPRRRFASTVCYARTVEGRQLTELLEFTRMTLPQAAAA